MSPLASRLSGIVLVIAVLIGFGLARPTLRGDEPKTAPALRDVSRTAADAFLKERREEIQALEDKVRKLREELSRDLKDIRQEKIAAVRRAEARHEEAVKARMGAEISAKHYLKFTFAEEQETVQTDIQVCEVSLKLAESDVRCAEELAGFDDADGADRFDSRVAEARLKKLKAEFALEEARTKLKVLREFTKVRRMKELEAQVEAARAKEIAVENELNGAQAEAELVQRDTEKFRMLSPEEHILSQLHESINDQSCLTDILHRVRELHDAENGDPADVEKRKQQLADLKSQADQLASGIKQKLQKAIGLSEHLTERWDELMEAEFQLKQARDRMATALGLLAPEAEK